MKKILAGFVVALIAVTFASINSEKAHAGITDYTFTWSNTNVYSDETIAFIATGLDTTVSYSWTVEMIDDFANAFFTVGVHTEPVGSAAAAFTIGPVVVQPYMGDWPFDFTGPFRVKDNFGQVVMKGFVAIKPGTVWESGAGQNAYIDKVIAGTPEHQGSCRNAVYNPLNAAGWHYEQSRPCQNAVRKDVETDYAIMHFNLDCVDYQAAAYTTESYRFYEFDGTEVFRIDLIDILNYNTHAIPAGCGGGFTNVWETFVVLNVNGDDFELPFIDTLWSEQNFTVGQDPHVFDFDRGGYYIQKRDAAGAYEADGEAPFLISNAEAGREWTITIASIELSPGADLIMTFKANTVELWDDYHGLSLCQNDDLTWSDTTIYGFSRNRIDSNPVPNIAATDDFIECVVNPTVFQAVAMSASEAAVITESERYDVVAGPIRFEESVVILIRDAKLDTEAGLNAVFAIILAVTMLLVTVIPFARRNTFAYLLAWTIVGGVWVGFGPSTGLGLLMWSIITVVLWLLVLTGNQGGGEIETV